MGGIFAHPSYPNFGYAFVDYYGVWGNNVDTKCHQCHIYVSLSDFTATVVEQIFCNVSSRRSSSGGAVLLWIGQDNGKLVLPLAVVTAYSIIVLLLASKRHQRGI